MTTVKISALPAITSANATDADLVPLVSSFSGIATTYKITVANLRAQLNDAAQTFSGAVTVQAGLTVSGTTALQALTATTGVFSSSIALGGVLDARTIVGRFTILGGTTGITIANNANTLANLDITDAGAATFRSTLTVSAGGLTVTAGGITVTAGGITVNSGTTAVQSITATSINAVGTGTFGTGLTVSAGGLTVTAGGLTVSAGTLTVSAGGISITGGGTFNGSFTFNNDVTIGASGLLSTGPVRRLSGVTASVADTASAQVLAAASVSDGVYLVNVFKTGTAGAHVTGTVTISSGVTSTSTLVTLGGVTLATSGVNVDLTNNTGSAGTFTWAYLKVI